MVEPAHCVLSILDRGKNIPYTRAERPEGSVNHGFVLLKGNPLRVDEVPEASGDAGLTDAIKRLNESTTAFFTVGCEKAVSEIEGRYIKKGYLEFSFNFVDLVQDETNYFVLFFKFTKMLQEAHFDLPVQFCWELEGATFTSVNCKGWTAGVWITTTGLPTKDEAETLWSEAIRTLVNFLCEEKCHGFREIFSSRKPGQ